MGEVSSSEKTMQYQVKGAERERILRKCMDKIAEWGLTMPTGQVLVSDWQLADFEKTGLIEFWIANEGQAGYCGKFLFVFDGQTCPYHRHRTKHETFYVLKGKVDMTVNGETRTLNQGDVLSMPPGTMHSFTGLGDALLVEVSMPCIVGDNFFEDKRIGEEGVI